MTINSLSDHELNQLAKDIWAGKVFTDRHLRHPEDVKMVFMILNLLDEDQQMKFLEGDPGMLYEYISEAGPRSVNGYPSFFSMRTLNKADTEKLMDKLRRIEEALTGVLGETR